MSLSGSAFRGRRKQKELMRIGLQSDRRRRIMENPANFDISRLDSNPNQKFSLWSDTGTMITAMLSRDDAVKLVEERKAFIVGDRVVSFVPRVEGFSD